MLTNGLFDEQMNDAGQSNIDNILDEENNDFEEEEDDDDDKEISS
jgi:hypothetical protein